MYYFKTLNISNLDIIVQELSSEKPASNITEGKSFTYEESLNKFPTLIKWVESVSSLPLHRNSTVKIFVTAPMQRGLIHIDHHTTSRVGINIPILNCQGTRFVYYETPEDNLIENIGDDTLGYRVSLTPVDFKLVKPVDSLELTTPHLIRTDKLHRAINYTRNARIIATIRWEANRHLTEFEDFINAVL